MNRQIAYVASATGTPDSGAGRNRYVFPGMLCVSILLHALLLVMMSDHIDSRETSVIELTLESVDKTPGRSLPRPHFRPKNPVLPQELVHQKVVVRREPLQNPLHLEQPHTELPENLVAKIDVPDVPETLSAAPSNFAASDSSAGSGGQFRSAQDYFDMIRLRIETNKKYPTQAKVMQREGRVTVSFIITMSGLIESCRIVKSSGNKSLDKAALRAVTKSSPIMVPPSAFFSGSVPIQLTISFTLL